jgi:hypothetical protein
MAHEWQLTLSDWNTIGGYSSYVINRRGSLSGVPGCGTGPAGRIVFVARELASLWRELTGHARTTPGPDTDEDQQ